MIDPVSKRVQRAFAATALVGFLCIVVGVPVAAFTDKPHLFFAGFAITAALAVVVICGACVYLWVSAGENNL